MLAAEEEMSLARHTYNLCLGHYFPGLLAKSLAGVGGRHEQVGDLLARIFRRDHRHRALLVGLDLFRHLLMHGLGQIQLHLGDVGDR